MDASILEKLKHFCAYQERSHRDVRTKLLELEIYGDDLEQYLSELIQENFLNEERFAIAYAGGKFRIKQWGRNKIKYGLKQHQVSDYCIQKALREIDDQDYMDCFRREAHKKLAQLEKERSVIAKKTKLKNYLQQKGFEAEFIYTFIQQNIT